MKHLVAALALALALAVPRPAAATDTWELIKEEWEMRPWAVLIAAPAFIVTAPFMLVKEMRESTPEESEPIISRPRGPATRRSGSRMP